MTALVDTPLRCGWIDTYLGQCLAPATHAVPVLMPCDCAGTVYSCTEHASTEADPACCHDHGNVGPQGAPRLVHEGDLPDQPDEQIVGRRHDGRVVFPR